MRAGGVRASFYWTDVFDVGNVFHGRRVLVVVSCGCTFSIINGFRFA